MSDVEIILTNLLDNGKGWKSLTAKEWVVLLCKSDEFAAKCNKVNGWASFDGHHWLYLLKANAKYFDELVKHDGFSKLDSSCWITLIIERPEMANKYRHKIFDYDELWKKILNSLSHFGVGWKFFDNSDWLRLLKVQPRYVGKCDEFKGWDKLTNQNVIELFKNAPLYIERFPLWSRFDARDWVCLLDELPQLAVKCDMVNGWKNFGSVTFDFLDHYNNWNCWAYILSVHPEFANRCDAINGWHEFTPNDWVKLLTSNNAFIDRCDKVNGWASFDRHHWVRLLKKQPSFSTKCDSFEKWKEFSGFDWVVLLREQPGFSVKCDLVDGWYKIDFTVTSSHSDRNNSRQEFITHGMVVNDMGKYTGIKRIEYTYYEPILDEDPPKDIKIGYVGYDENNHAIVHFKMAPLFCGRWVELLECQPQFAAKCNQFNGWDALDGFDWFRLLSTRPQFITKCNESNAWRKMFYCRSKEYNHLEDEGGGSYSEWSEYSHEPLFNVPPEYEEEFSRENILPADHCYNGLPIDCWMGETEYMELSQKRINLTNEEKTVILKTLNKDFWIYFLNQKPSSALSIATRHRIDDIWQRFTINDWKQAIVNKKKFLDRITNLTDDDNTSKCVSEAEFLYDKFLDALITAWPDFLGKEDWMRLINRYSALAIKYAEHCHINDQTLSEIVRCAKEFVNQENDDRHPLDDNWQDDSLDWREESGWNDVYGSDVDASDIIEFRD